MPSESRDIGARDANCCNYFNMYVAHDKRHCSIFLPRNSELYVEEHYYYSFLIPEARKMRKKTFLLTGVWNRSSTAFWFYSRKCWQSRFGKKILQLREISRSFFISINLDCARGIWQWKKITEVTSGAEYLVPQMFVSSSMQLCWRLL